MKKSEFESFDSNKKSVNKAIIIISIIAICITGILYSRKLKQESAYISALPTESITTAAIDKNINQVTI